MASPFGLSSALPQTIDRELRDFEAMHQEYESSLKACNETSYEAIKRRQQRRTRAYNAIMRVWG